MKLPRDVVIADEKLTHYLLVWRARNDKSAYLAQAGYEFANWQMLREDLRHLAQITDAESLGTNPFGEFLAVRGELRGPWGLYLR